jgi:hypothetical protein
MFILVNHCGQPFEKQKHRLDQHNDPQHHQDALVRMSREFKVYQAEILAAKQVCNAS